MVIWMVLCCQVLSWKVLFPYTSWLQLAWEYFAIHYLHASPFRVPGPSIAVVPVVAGPVVPVSVTTITAIAKAFASWVVGQWSGGEDSLLCMYVYVYVYIYICCNYNHEWMDGLMGLWIYLPMDLRIYALLHLCFYTSMHLCRYAGMQVRTYACTHVRMYATCPCVHVCMCACMYLSCIQNVCVYTVHISYNHIWVYILYIYIRYMHISVSALPWNSGTKIVQITHQTK
jgi:hypothetical protein